MYSLPSSMDAIFFAPALTETNGRWLEDLTRSVSSSSRITLARIIRSETSPASLRSAAKVDQNSLF